MIDGGGGKGKLGGSLAPPEGGEEGRKGMDMSVHASLTRARLVRRVRAKVA